MKHKITKEARKRDYFNYYYYHHQRHRDIVVHDDHQQMNGEHTFNGSDAGWQFADLKCRNVISATANVS